MRRDNRRIAVEHHIAGVATPVLHIADDYYRFARGHWRLCMRRDNRRIASNIILQASPPPCYI